MFYNTNIEKSCQEFMRFSAIFYGGKFNLMRQDDV